MYAVYEARVRKFDKVTKVATVVMPGVYGMEPIEAPPFTRTGMNTAVIEDLVVGDRVLVVQGENEVPEWLSTNPDWYRVSGPVSIVTNGPNINLAPAAANQYAYVAFHDETFNAYAPILSSRHGWVGKHSTTGAIWLAADTGYDLMLFAPGSHTATITAGGITALVADLNGVNIPSPAELAFGASVRQMINLYGSTYGIGVQSNTQYYRSAGNFAWYRGGVHSGTALDPGAGGVKALTIRADGVIEDFLRIQGVMRAQVGMAVYGRGSAYIQFYDNSGVTAPDPDVLNTRTGYIGFSGTTSPAANHLYIQNENGVDTRLYSGSGSIILITDATERARLTSTAYLFGKTGYNTYQTVGGVEIWHADAQVMITQTTNTFNSICHVNGSAADAISVSFLRFYTGTTIMGNITQSSTGVTYGNVSHGPWKGNVQDLDDDEALERLARWRPVAYQWKYNADGIRDEDGEPSGDFEHGFIAQELYEVEPTAVGKGYGTQDDQRVWLERKAFHEAAHADEESPMPFEEQDPFLPWTIDAADLVPDMVAAMQAMMRQIEALQEEVALLRSAPGDEGR